MTNLHYLALELENTKKEYYKLQACSVPFGGYSNVHYLKSKIESLEYALNKEEQKYIKEQESAPHTDPYKVTTLQEAASAEEITNPFEGDPMFEE